MARPVHGAGSDGEDQTIVSSWVTAGRHKWVFSRENRRVSLHRNPFMIEPGGDDIFVFSNVYGVFRIT